MEKTCPINLKKDVMEFLEHIGKGKGKGKTGKGVNF